MKPTEYWLAIIAYAFFALNLVWSATNLIVSFKVMSFASAEWRESKAIVKEIAESVKEEDDPAMSGYLREIVK